jgi:hypothetical protein
MQIGWPVGFQMISLGGHRPPEKVGRPAKSSFHQLDMSSIGPTPSGRYSTNPTLRTPSSGRSRSATKFVKKGSFPSGSTRTTRRKRPSAGTTRSALKGRNFIAKTKALGLLSPNLSSAKSSSEKQHKLSILRPTSCTSTTWTID